MGEGLGPPTDAGGGMDHYGQHRELAATVEAHDERLTTEAQRLTALELDSTFFLWWLYGLSFACFVLLILVIIALL